MWQNWTAPMRADTEKGEVFEGRSRGSCHPLLPFVILSAAKDLRAAGEILRCAQDDKGRPVYFQKTTW